MTKFEGEQLKSIRRSSEYITFLAYTTEIVSLVIYIVNDDCGDLMFCFDLSLVMHSASYC